MNHINVANLQHKPQCLVGWKLASASLNVASVRYRALLPVLLLQDNFCRNRIFTNPLFSNLNDLDCLIFVKSFKPDDYLLAIEASQRGIPVILDLCDNIFIKDYGNKHPKLANLTPAQIFQKMAEMASTVVVSTEALATVVHQLGISCPVEVIPDGIETEALNVRMSHLMKAVQQREGNTMLQLLKVILLKLRKQVSLSRTMEFKMAFHFAIRTALKSILTSRGSSAPPTLKATPTGHEANPCSLVHPTEAKLKSVLWFGHHGADYAKFGMLDLLQIQADLEDLSHELSFELVVVSNNREKFNKYIRPFKIPTRFVEWSSEALAQELSNACVVVVPNSLDAFSICKSPNRAVLALKNRVPVVATSTPALSELASCIVLDDFREGVRRYLSDSAKRSADITAAQSLIESLYGDTCIHASWQRVLQRAVNTSPPTPTPITLLIVLQNSLDWQLLYPVIKEALKRGIQVGALLNSQLPDQMVFLGEHLKSLRIETFLVDPDDVTTFIFPPELKVILCAAESNAFPHRIAHEIVKRANQIGLYSATLQHGFETPGLTYHDHFHSISKTKFAAQRIYLWSTVETLHPEVPKATREKCLSVGMPVFSQHCISPAKTCSKNEPLTVGIFENLHWLRYSPQYKQFFLKGVLSLAEQYDNVRFVFRTHPQGRWIDREEAKPLCQISNIKIALDNDLSEDTLSMILSSVDAIITTPSTVAIHAARQELPVAVVGSDLVLDRYSPLPIITQENEWASFVGSLTDPSKRDFFMTLSRQFISQSIYSGDASTRIVDDILSHI